MKPYYEAEGVTLYCADMRAVDLPPADLVLTDPPYSEATHQGARTNPTTGIGGEWKSGGNEGQVLIDFDSISDAELRECFTHITPCCRRWLVSFLDRHHVHSLEVTPPEGLRFVRFGVWTKPNGAPQFSGDRPAQGWEAIAFLHRVGGRMVWNGGGATAVYNYPVVPSNHRTAKPPRLIAKLIEQFSNKGDLILDPFAGGGVVLHTAQLMGRRAVGVEKDEARCAQIVEWLKAGRLPKVPRTVAPMGPLFDMEAQ